MLDLLKYDVMIKVEVDEMIDKVIDNIRQIFPVFRFFPECLVVEEELVKRLVSGRTVTVPASKKGLVF